MKIAVIGTGYVGLVTGTCFAETGNQVICVDTDESKVQRMKSGEVPIYEPDLDVLFERNARQGRLSFTTNLREAVEHAEIIFLALPTPPGKDGLADLTAVIGVAKDLSELITTYKVIVDKSTVPVGTAEEIAEILGNNLNSELFDVVSNPEFLREGVAVDDFLKPDRVVIGTNSLRARKMMKQLYLPFVRQGNPIFFMDERSAEMTKYAANAYLATRISFMNEIANVCEKVGADVEQIRIGIGSDTRIGKRFLFPGVGYGGSCFPKDVKALARTSKAHGYSFGILDAVMDVNERQKVRLVDKMADYFDNNFEGLKVAVWGLSFKPETDDIREAPSLSIINELMLKEVKIAAYDPEAMGNVKRIYGDKIKFGETPYDILHGADALVIVTEWSVFRNPDFAKMRDLMTSPVIFDGRNLYGLEQMETYDFYYNSIGRETINRK